tara:strand:- start:738 stop:899 length:162 start_codon:yes stop_codon:yes gene_type:complete
MAIKLISIVSYLKISVLKIDKILIYIFYVTKNRKKNLETIHASRFYFKTVFYL